MASRVRTKRETFWERMWAATIVAYSFGAAVLVWKTLHKYGVNPYVFFVIDVSTSWPYGLATARIVVAFFRKDWGAVRKWSWLAGITFITPQVYILASARHVPNDVYLIIAAVITVLAVFAIGGVVQQIRAGKGKESSTLT